MICLLLHSTEEPKFLLSKSSQEFLCRFKDLEYLLNVDLSTYVLKWTQTTHVNSILHREYILFLKDTSLSGCRFKHIQGDVQKIACQRRWVGNRSKTKAANPVTREKSKTGRIPRAMQILTEYYYGRQNQRYRRVNIGVHRENGGAKHTVQKMLINFKSRKLRTNSQCKPD